MPDPDAPKGMQYRIAPDVIRVATARVYGSQTFKAAKQQETLLRFLVEDYLAGRAQHGSREAVIADFFADRTPEEADKKLAWAMARLSEKLTLYYATEGADDPIRIAANAVLGCLDFKMWEGEATSTAIPANKLPLRLALPLIALIAALIVGVAALFWPGEFAGGVLSSERSTSLEQPVQVPDFPERYLGLSVPELTDLAREYLYPTLDMERQRVAIAISREVIRRDPENGTGYATAGYSLATLSLLSSGGALSRRHLKDAGWMRDQALARSPEDAWVLSAAAVVAFAEQDFQTSVETSERAYSLGSHDPHVSAAYSLIAIVTNRYENAREASEKDRIVDLPYTAIARERLYALASFHVGEYGDTIEILEAAEREGRGYNVTTVMYLAAAHQAMGNHERAKAMVQRIRAEWPTFRPEMIATVFFRDPNETEYLMQNLAAAGWSFID